MPARELLKAVAALTSLALSLVPYVAGLNVPDYVGKGATALFALVGVGLALFTHPPRRKPKQQIKDPIMTFNPSVHLAGVEASAIATDATAGGSLKIYTGTKPATPETTASGTLLATISLSTFTASGNVITSNDPAQVTPAAAGTAGWARLLKSDGTTVDGDMDVTATGSGGDVQLATTTIQTAVPIDLSAITITVPEV